MAVLLQTSLGELAVDLFCDEAPIACKNFLKLCKIKYYNNNLFYNVQSGLLAQCGDPTGTGKGGTSVYGLCYGEQAALFEDECPSAGGRKPNQKGLICMANAGQPNTNGSQFFFTLRGDDLDHLAGKHTIFGEVAEGMEVLDALNLEYVDGDGRPFRDIRLQHTFVLEDPYEDPPALEVPPSSPLGDVPTAEVVKPRLSVIEDPAEALKSEEERREEMASKEAKSRALVLEMLGDLPDVEARAPENVLFVAKLNPVTRDEDLELIFSRFGAILDCQIIRDPITGDSLNYAFVEFKDRTAAEEGYKKMDGVLIDDRRIKVDFSQSVSKLWNRFTEQPRKKSRAPNTTNNDHHKTLVPPAAATRGKGVGKGVGASAGSGGKRDEHDRSSSRPEGRGSGRGNEPPTYKSRFGDRNDNNNDDDRSIHSSSRRENNNESSKRSGRPDEHRRRSRSRDRRDRSRDHNRDHSRERSRDQE